MDKHIDKLARKKTKQSGYMYMWGIILGISSGFIPYFFASTYLSRSAAGQGEEVKKIWEKERKQVMIAFWITFAVVNIFTVMLGLSGM